jgi:hypothetical protein
MAWTFATFIRRATLPYVVFSLTLGLIEVHFTPEQEAKLAQSAARRGRNPDELGPGISTRKAALLTR